MASIEKRTNSKGHITYRAKVRLKGYPSQSATFERITDARKWITQTEAAIRERRHFKIAEAKKHTLTELIDRYCAQVLIHKPKSQKDQGTQLAWWKEQLGSFLLSDITPALIAEYRDKLGTGMTVKGTPRSHATVNRYLAALSHVFTIAVKEWGWVEDNPISKLRRLKENRPRVRFLSDIERERLLIACKKDFNPYIYLVVTLALSCGARRNEIMSLCWSDVDLERRLIKLEETKNGERRALPLVGLALKLMNDLHSKRRQDTDLVFPSSNPHKPFDIRAPWERVLQRAEIIDYRFHDNRHSAASYLAMNGASLAEIAAVLGHKTLQMVKRYSHLSPAHTAQVVERMNNKIFGGED